MTTVVTIVISTLIVTITQNNAVLGHHDLCLTAQCEYDFVVRHQRTMVYRPPGKSNGYSVRLDGDRLKIVESAFRRPPDDYLGTQVNASDVITADGYVRNVITINGHFPGPTIRVSEGAQVVVRVTNKLQTEGLTIHWHGMHQRHNAWMDGTTFVTQCPIQPSQSFTYRFEASPAGTHWYHSHFGNQRMDGLYGMLIVHRTMPVRPEFAIIVTDWLHEEGSTLEITNPYSMERGDKGAGEDLHLHESIKDVGIDGVEMAGVTYTSGLINGRGRHNQERFPLADFEVEQNKTYRFRTVNTGGEFRFRVGIDRHVLRVVALDGAEIEPFTVDGLVLAPGERADFEVEADQPPTQYWLRASTMKDTSRDPTVQEVKAVLFYKGVNIQGDPTSVPRACTPARVCRVLNCPFPDFPSQYGIKCVSIAEMKSTEQGMDDQYGLKSDDVTELFLNAGFNWGSSVNGRKFVHPSAPLFQKDSVSVPCAERCSDPRKGCVCTGEYVLPFNRTIQLVLSNLEYGMPSLAHHPMHLHGHHFAVLKIGYGAHNAATGKYENHTNDVICSESLCRQPRWNGRPPKLNLDRPPLKDTIVVPARGYVVVRLRSDNPGPWLYHCHAVTHMFEGMTTLIDEAPGRYPGPPPGFPTCHSFNWTSSEFDNFRRKSKDMFANNGDEPTDVYTQESPTNVAQEKKTKMGNDNTDNMLQQCLEKSADGVNMATNNFIGVILGSVVIGAILAIASMAIVSYCGKLSARSKLSSTKM